MSSQLVLFGPEPQTAIGTFLNDTKINVPQPLAAWLDEWKQLRREGWDVTVLLSPDSKKVIGLACLGGPA